MTTRPGFHPDADFSDYPENILPAIRSIARHFYVTRSFKPERIGNSEYWAILARPTDDFSIHLNADREIVVLFSNYENFEIRTLEAYEEFYALLESKRADKSIRFLVSMDKRIEAIVSHYLNQHPEYPIIVPIQLKEVESRENSLLEAIRRNYLLRDLFGYQSPLREETFFFGRQDVVSTVLDLAKSGQSSSLFGLRKSGKTSTIYAIQRRARSFSCLPILVDCQSPAIHAKSYSDLLAHIIGEVRKAIGQQQKIPDLGQDAASISEAFQMHMKTALGQAKGTVLLIFDEIENISPDTAASPHWKNEVDPLFFWQNLRSFLQAESKGALSICIVGTSPALLERTDINGVPNPMYLFSQKTFIPSFSFADTKEMIDKLGYFMGLEFSSEQIARLRTLYGGHPFFIRQVCSKVHQAASQSRPVLVSEKLLETAIQQFAGQLESYLSDILGQLSRVYPDEYELLRSIIRGEKDELNEFGRCAPELIDHLIGYGIIEERAGEYDVRFDAIRVALNKAFRDDSLEARWAEVSRRRNIVESELRKELYHWSKSVPLAEWASILERQLSNSRFTALPSVEPRILFSRQGSPLYFSDIMRILKSENVLPYLEDRRDEVLKAMALVNIHRKDAHANEFSDAEISDVRDALDLLESEFLQP